MISTFVPGSEMHQTPNSHSQPQNQHQQQALRPSNNLSNNSNNQSLLNHNIFDNISSSNASLRRNRFLHEENLEEIKMRRKKMKMIGMLNHYSNMAGPDCPTDLIEELIKVRILKILSLGREQGNFFVDS